MRSAILGRKSNLQMLVFPEKQATDICLKPVFGFKLQRPLGSVGSSPISGILENKWFPLRPLSDAGDNFCLIDPGTVVRDAIANVFSPSIESIGFGWCERRVMHQLLKVM